MFEDDLGSGWSADDTFDEDWGAGEYEELKRRETLASSNAFTEQVMSVQDHQTAINLLRTRLEELISQDPASAGLDAADIDNLLLRIVGAAGQSGRTSSEEIRESALEALNFGPEGLTAYAIETRRCAIRAGGIESLLALDHEELQALHVDD